MIVVDANVVAYLLIEGERTIQARDAWRADPDWHAPALLMHEFLNILTSYEREGGLSIPECLELLGHCRKLLHGREHEVSGELTLRLAAALSLSAYDAQYVALAETLDTALLTEDRALLDNAPRRALSLARHLAD